MIRNNFLTITTRTMPPPSFQTVDLTVFFQSPHVTDAEFPSADQISVAKQVNAAFRDHGFLFVQNFGLSQRFLQDMFHTSALLFSHPSHAKETNLKPFDLQTNTGYLSSGKEGLNAVRGSDSKEVIIFKMFFILSRLFILVFL